MKQVDSAAKVTVKQSPEGYYIVRSDKLRLDFGITAQGGEISANIVNAYSSYPGQGVVTNIFGQCFKAAEQLWGKPTKFAMSAHEDRGHGVWQHIAKKLGAEWEGSLSVMEGGWASTATQNTVITPAVIGEAVANLNEFAREYNAWQAENELGLEIKIGNPKGSGTYYKRDLQQDPEREYGDIDIECFIHSREGVSSAQLITQYKNAIVEFTKHSQDFSSDNGTNVIMNTSAGPAQRTCKLESCSKS
jgi:hypothetical protein